jgi:hypothetical protein
MLVHGNGTTGASRARSLYRCTAMALRSGILVPVRRDDALVLLVLCRYNRRYLGLVPVLSSGNTDYNNDEENHSMSIPQDTDSSIKHIHRFEHTISSKYIVFDKVIGCYRHIIYQHGKETMQF